MTRLSRWELGVLAAGSALAWIYAGYFYPGFFNDDARFLVLAKSLLQGRYAMISEPGQPAAGYPLPGYPLLVALPADWGGPDSWAVRAVSAASLLGAFAALSGAAPAAPGPRAAALGAFLLNPVLLRFSGAALSQPAYLLASALVLRAWAGGRFSWPGASALAFAAVLNPHGWLLLAAGLIPARGPRGPARRLDRRWLWCAVPLAAWALRGTCLFASRDSAAYLPPLHLPAFPPPRWWVHWPTKAWSVLVNLYAGIVFPLPAWHGPARAAAEAAAVAVGAVLTLVGLSANVREAPGAIRAAWYLALCLGAWVFVMGVELGYLLTSLAVVIPAVAAGGHRLASRWGRGAAPAALAAWAALYGWAHWREAPEALAASWRNTPARESLAWIRDSLGEGAILSAAAPLIHLHTGRQARQYYETETFFRDNRGALEAGRIRYVVFLGRTAFMAAGRGPYRVLNARDLEAMGAELIYSHQAEQTRIYELGKGSPKEPARR